MLGYLVKIYEQIIPLLTRQIMICIIVIDIVSRYTQGLLVIRLTIERPIVDILQYRSKTRYNDALKRNRAFVTIPSAYTHFCAQACQGDIYKTVVYTSAVAFNAFEERVLHLNILLKPCK